MPDNEKDFSDVLMSNLSAKERLGVMYFAAINTLKQKIEDNTKLLFKLCTDKEDNVIFSSLFFLFVILTGNDNEVKNTLLKCKEEEFKEKNKKDEEINQYIDDFNKRVKELAQIYLDVNGKVQDDKMFQDELIKNFSAYLMGNLNIEMNDESYSELYDIFLSALKIAFNFRDSENIKLNIKEN